MRKYISCYGALIVSLIFSPVVFAVSQNEIPISDIFASQSDSIVLIGAVGGGADKVGSGFFVSADGVIVTNGHLIQDARNLVVKLKDKTGYTKIRVVKLDAKKDIAVIKIDGKNFKSVRLGNSDTLEVGQRVVAIGNPLGLESTVSDGLISALRKTNAGIKLLQVSVPLSPGSSGGPLFNLQGEVVGITTASFLEGQNLNFAVPINYVKSLLPRSAYKNSQRMLGKVSSTGNLPLSSTAFSSDKDKKYTLYTVKPNDTLYSISRKFSVSVKSVSNLNGLTDEQVKSGQQIRIPIR